MVDNVSWSSESIKSELWFNQPVACEIAVLSKLLLFVDIFFFFCHLKGTKFLFYFSLPLSFSVY